MFGVLFPLSGFAMMFTASLVHALTTPRLGNSRTATWCAAGSRYLPTARELRAACLLMNGSRSQRRLGDMQRIALPFVLFCLASSGCAHRSVAFTSDRKSFEDLRVEAERAIELERRADVVIDYEWPDRIRLWTSAQTDQVNATEETLAAAIAIMTPKRELAVVLIGKPVRNAFPESQLRAKVDSVEADLRALGFARVIFQLASATGRPIYRE